MPDIEMKRGYEVLPDNNVRFGIRVINNSDFAISDVEVILDYNESLFDLEGTKIQKLSTIPPAVQRTAKFILKPLGCIHKEEIGATVLYKDHQWKKHTEEMRPKEVHCVCPFLKEKLITRAEFLKMSNSGYLEERGVSFGGIKVDKLVSFLSHTCKNRLYKVDEFPFENGKILYLAGEALGEKAYYLLTAVIKEYEGLSQVLLRASSDKNYGLNGFLNEVLDNLHHLVATAHSASEIGVIKKEHVINIIDSVVQRTNFAVVDDMASVNISGSAVQRTEIKVDEEGKRLEEKKIRKERENQENEGTEKRGKIASIIVFVFLLLSILFYVLGSMANIWAAPPSIPANGTDIFSHSGNPDIPSLSNPSVFELSESFETYPQGQNLIGQNGWFNGYISNDNIIIVESDHATHGNQSLRMYSYYMNRGSARKFVNITHDVLIEFDARTDKPTSNTYAWFYFNFYGDSGYITNLFFDRAYDGYGEKISAANYRGIQNYVPNTWYNFKLYIKFSTQTYDVWVNGVKRLSNANFVSATSTLKWIDFDIYGGSIGGVTPTAIYGWVDNISIRQFGPSEPSARASEIREQTYAGVMVTPIPIKTLAAISTQDTGLIAKYHFDGNVKDSSGYGNDGIIHGATFVDGIKG